MIRVLLRRPSLLPFGEVYLEPGQETVVRTAEVLDPHVQPRRLVLDDKTRAACKVKAGFRTTEQWVSADLAAQIEFSETLMQGQIFEMLVKNTSSGRVLFVGALQCLNSYDP